MAKQKYLECGKIVSTHGVRGTVRLESYCNTPETLAKLRRLYIKKPSADYELMKVRASSVQKQMVLCTFESVTTLDQAIPLKGTVVYADRSDIATREGDFFVADMIGLDVIDCESGEKYGTLSEVMSPAGRDIYVVNDVRGGTFMVPAVPEFVRDIKIEGDGEGIYVKLIEGLREEHEN